MITQNDKEEMLPAGNNVVSIKFSSSEHVIGQYIELLSEEGMMVIKNPLKVLQGVNADGIEYVLMHRYDPLNADDTVYLSAAHVLSLQPVSYAYKKKYVTNVIRYKAVDFDAVAEAEMLDLVTSQLMSICEEIGVKADLDLLPIDHKTITRH